LRFNRDRRGYETTTLVHNARRRGKGQSRILYWFRTPPGVRVGRSAIDEDAIRLLEQHNPDVQFDWTHILKPTPPQPAPADGPKDRPFEHVQGRAQRRIERRAFPRAPESTPAVAPPARPADATRSDEGATARRSSPERFEEPEAAVASDSVEASIAEDMLRGVDDEPVAEPGPEDRTSAAYQRLGSEGLARLRARYAEVMARIGERPMDEGAREELKLRAERLNPDGWVTTDEVQHALEQYESVFEELRALVGTRRRRRRRRTQAGSKREGAGQNPEA
jgi:hypothetical protein